VRCIVACPTSLCSVHEPQQGILLAASVLAARLQAMVPPADWPRNLHLAQPHRLLMTRLQTVSGLTAQEASESGTDGRAAGLGAGRDDVLASGQAASDARAEAARSRCGARSSYTDRHPQAVLSSYAESARLTQRSSRSSEQSIALDPRHSAHHGVCAKTFLPCKHPRCSRSDPQAA